MIWFKKMQYRIQGRPYVDTTTLGDFGEASILHRDCTILFPERCHVGSHVRIGEGAYWNAEGGLTIGNNVIFAPRTTLWTMNHNWRSAECLPYGTDDLPGPIIIADHVWVCLEAKILPGVTIGEGAIIAMGAVVTRDVAPLTVVGGNPARKVAERDPDTFETAKATGRFLLAERARQARKT